MRTFIAIDLPDNIKETLRQLQDKLKASGAEVNWVEPENIHLTLKFLGEIDKALLPKIISVIEAAALSTTQFTAKISSCGAFPKLNFPKIIWLGVDSGADKIKDIARGLEDSLAQLGVPKEERTFSAHITIGRTKSQQNRDKLIQGLGELGSCLEKDSLEFNVGKISLFKSTLTPNGSIYEVLKEVNLKTI
ncbi:MAG: RNA 2',3'-cyclic phosphodiesterase [Candidatus Omnitrophica bacterium]|nr:RNA 2',3'-cyclic phosphodiesterase [Candidatus Omnitrophota bacterium]